MSRLCPRMRLRFAGLAMHPAQIPRLVYLTPPPPLAGWRHPAFSCLAPAAPKRLVFVAEEAGSFTLVVDQTHARHYAHKTISSSLLQLSVADYEVVRSEADELRKTAKHQAAEIEMLKAQLAAFSSETVGVFV